MKKKILPDLSTRLKKIRQQTGCDKKEMADRLGVTTSGYYKNEHGDTLPSVSSLKRKNLQAECKKRDEVLTKLQE